MEHRLVTHIEKALGWDGPGSVGTAFARGRLTDPELPARLLTPHKLLDLIKRRHLANPQLRCYAEGDEIHPSTFLSTNVNRRRQAVSQADMAALGRILNNGGTVVLDHVDFFDPTLEVACRALGWWSGELTSANAYLAVGETDGFHLHWDDHEVIAVQLSGEKSWEVRGPSRSAPMYRDAERNRTPSEEVLWKGTMRAGDVMHIPRGFWHTATRLGSGSSGHSLHVTFGFTKRTGVTWANFLSDAARADEAFRRDLEGAEGTAHEVLADKLSALAATYSPDRYLDELRSNTPPARHMPYVTAFGRPAGVAAVTEFAPSIVRSGDRLQVCGGGKRLTLHERAEPGLRALLSGHPVYLDGADEDTTTLADLLITEGLCEPLTETSFSGYTGLVTPRDVLEAAADLGVARIDTASNYLRHRSHEVLKTVAGDLLPKLAVSTKVGYFPGEHSLAPARLRAGVEQAVKDLGREPDTVLLHNPEHSHPDAEMLAQACAVLSDAAQTGLCGGWGVSSWDPRPLADLDAPRPDVLMVRSGLLVGADVLEAAEALVTRWRPSQVCGMSPFGGSTSEAVWGKFDPRIFLRNTPPATSAQAAFRAAYGLPRVDAVAVGTDNVDHLRELVGALAYEVDDQVVREYRRLLQARRQPV